MSTVETAESLKAEVSREAESEGFAARLAEGVGLRARASAVFGDPVEQSGVTVIPVAKASWGFGGGSGGEAANQGSGGGGGAVVAPIGFIEVRQDEARFVPIRDPRSTALRLAAAACVFGWMIRRR